MDRMRSGPSRWQCKPYEVAAAVRLAGELGVSHELATILVRRGLGSPVDARGFLEAGDRGDPLTLPGARRAADSILRHLRSGSRIVVHGDYDVDGVCSTAILVRTLRALGGHPSWEIPSRFDEGYGLSGATVERLAARGTQLLITVDCGITAVDEVAAARAAGIDVVVTDHHRPGEELPDCPVVHPSLGNYACPELCASGVALKLSETLHRMGGGDPREGERDIDLAALATVCDLVPLRGENRRIVREGLQALARTTKPGLRALMASAAVEPGTVDEQSLGFRLGPRINAAGRMQRADAALELLLTEDEARAREVAGELDLLNRDRRETELRILAAADAACAEQAAAAAIVVAGEGWHPGVVGIVASRLVERWCRPCVVVALEGDGGRGSGRSISPYDLHAGLASAAAQLLRFGGHRMAAGLELERDRLPAFRAALAAHAGAALCVEDLTPMERVDAVVPGSALGLPLADELERLRPFGMGNPRPTLLVPAARVEALATMGEDRQHARFVLSASGARSRGVAFNTPLNAIAPAKERDHELALRLERNCWNGSVEPRVVLRAACPSHAGHVAEVGDECFWPAFERELAADPAAAPPLAPLRETCDRRAAGFAAVVGDLLTSGEPTLVAVADVPRRRAGLEELVAGLAPGGLAVAAWDRLAARPELAEPFAHVVALDPPPLRGLADALPGPAGALAHLAWTAADAAFAREVWSAELGLEGALRETWRALRDLDELAGEPLRAALSGRGRYPRSPAACARIVRVLGELSLVRYEGEERCTLLDAARTELSQSGAFRAYGSRFEAIERLLAPELGAPQPAAEPGPEGQPVLAA
jgi:single-stranded-DNA-specific exonuclease